MTNPIIVVVGSPKSGISIIGKCLHILGFKSFDDKVQPQVATIHHLLFQDLDHSPTMAGPLPPGWMQTSGAERARHRIHALTSDCRNKTGFFFLADPLLCRFIPLWVEVFQEAGLVPKFMFMVRHPWEAAPSLGRAENVDLAKAHLLWLSYILNSLRACQDQGNFLITFDQLLADPVSTLMSMGAELNLSWPKDPWSASSLLLDFIQPSLKHHYASNLPDKDKQKFQSYERLYQEIRQGQWSGMGGNVIDWHPLSEPYATLPKAKGVMSVQSPTIAGLDLVESLLDLVGQYEKRMIDSQSKQEKIASDLSSQLFTQITFPSTNERGKIVETIPLIADEWQHIVLDVPDTSLLQNKSIKLNPLNVNGTVMISSLKLVDLAYKEVLWAVQTPQDFEVLSLSGTVLRIPDLDNFILLVTGNEPCLDLPNIENLPNCPVRFEGWIRVCRSQQILHRGVGRRHHRRKGSSNIVWLASYPRSGNTLLRIILNHNFGLKSYSIYNDNNDIGKFVEVSEVVGHQFMNWPLFIGDQHAVKLQPKDFEQFDVLRYKTQNLKLIKTHSSYHQGFAKDKVIYIYRDGRAALRSFASYKDKFNQNDNSLHELLDTLLCCGDNMSGLWSEHALSWMQHPKDKILFLKFEDVVSDFNTTFKKIAAFLEIDPVRTDVLSFEQLHAINSDFFRKGQKKSWQDLFDDTRSAMFWILNYKTMSALGYDKDQHPICEMLATNSRGVKSDLQKRGVSVELLMEFDQTLQKCAEILNNNFDNVLDYNRLLIGNQLKKVYLQFLDFFKTYAPQGSVYGWTDKWNVLLNDKIFSYTVSQRKIHLFDNGVKVYDDHLIPSQRERYCKRNVHEAEEEDIFVEMIKSIPSDGCFLNIGSAIGYYPILAKTLAPNINIYAIEPLERHRKYFFENIELNGFKLDNFTLLKEGISAESGTSKFLDSGYGSSIISDDNNIKTTLTIKTITLDNLICKIGYTVDFLQMDVQGFEIDVLIGGQQTLKQHIVKKFLIGTHTQNLHQKCISILKEHGYYIHIDRFETIDQPDGILLATLDN